MSLDVSRKFFFAFHTNDRFAEKYPLLSTYQYGNNNPVKNIDANGDSIVVLNYREGVHMAMLIQNNNNKWQYFSINGNNVYFSGNFMGGRKFDDIAVGEFNSPRDFFESSYNSKGDKNDKSINDYCYFEGYMIPTSEQQDSKMRETFIRISETEEYNLFGNNCVTTVQRAMEAAGFKIYDSNKHVLKIPANHYLGESSFSVTYENARPLTPNSALKAIMKYNPQGELIYRLKNKY